MVNKGGCLKGRVGEKPKGGCKVGKKNPQRVEPSKARGKPKTKAVKKAPARKAPVAKNKGGCLTGRVGERPNGGCRVGKKGPQRREPSKARGKPKAKTAFQLENERIRLLNQAEDAKPKSRVGETIKTTSGLNLKVVEKGTAKKKQANKTLNTVADMERALAEIKKKERRARAMAKAKSVRQKIGY